MRKTFSEALEAAYERLANMPSEEFDAMLEEGNREMREAVVEGREHLGYTMWLMQDYEAASAWRNKVLKDAKVHDKDQEGTSQTEAEISAQADQGNEGQE